MPELPEVETVLRNVKESGIIGSFISGVEVKKPSHIKGLTTEEFVKSLVGRKLDKLERKGKWIFFFLEDYVLNVHLRMTGKFFFSENEHKPCLIFNFSNGKKLIYCDPRGFGVFYLKRLEDFYNQKPYLDIGPDIIQDTISKNYLVSVFSKLKLPIKSVLLEQKIMSGIGNIYASEILFACKIDPLRQTKEIKVEEIENIIKQSKFILQKSIEMGGTSIVDFISPLQKKGSFQNELKVYMRDKKDCFDCSDKITSKVLNGRNTFFCKSCQI
jgi:formamidopyrimidine-DNA glycosylase